MADGLAGAVSGCFSLIHDFVWADTISCGGDEWCGLAWCLRGSCGGGVALLLLYYYSVNNKQPKRGKRCPESR